MCPDVHWVRWFWLFDIYTYDREGVFDRSHLPLMFVGMEHIMLSNYVLADEALEAAYSMCDGDPLLINERGVMAYNHGK